MSTDKRDSEAEKYAASNMGNPIPTFKAGWDAATKEHEASLAALRERYGQRIKTLVEERDSFIQIGNQAVKDCEALAARLKELQEPK